MPLQRLQFKPGVVKEVTQYSNSPGWYDADKVRFRAGYPESIGGWIQAEPTPFLGVCRALHQWSLLSGPLNIGIGTHLKYYILNSDQFYDITPQRSPISCPGNPFTSVTDPSSGVYRLQVTVPTHGCSANDFVTLSGAASSCGPYSASDLNQQFQVQSVTDANTLVLFGTKSTGSGGSTGGGVAVVATPDISAGQADAGINPGGFGAGAYGLGYYGAAGATRLNTFGTNVIQPRLWHHDNFGENILINPRGGPIYYWQFASDTFTGKAKNLTTVSGADADTPVVANGVFVSPISQSVVALGCNPIGLSTADPMQIRWSNLADPTTWTPLATNSAGGQRLASGSYIIGWMVTFQETLIWTDTSLYSMDFSGNTFVFSFRLIADGSSLISPNAAISTGSTVLWMDTNSFRAYDGAVSELPCSLKSYVFSNLNRLQSWKIFASHNHNFSEAWWFYPSLASKEIDSYVIYNYADGTWSNGMLNRTAWLDLGRLPSPLACDENGILYFHEIGTDANGSALASHIESTDVDLTGGDQFLFLSRIIPDVKFLGSAADYQQAFVQVLKRNSSGQTKQIDRTLAINPQSKNVFARSRGRRMSLKFGSNQIGTGWRLGTTEVEIAPDGHR